MYFIFCNVQSKIQIYILGYAMCRNIKYNMKYKLVFRLIELGLL